MSKTSGAAEFLQRWSRRKLAHAPNIGERPASEEPGRGPAAPPVDASATASAEEIHRDHLRRLWTSEPAQFGPDDLDDYLEDFTEAARAVPLGLLGSAYVIGRGFWSAQDRAESHTVASVSDGEQDEQTRYSSESTSQRDSHAGDAQDRPKGA
jgi:hypothetical protein